MNNKFRNEREPNTRHCELYYKPTCQNKQERNKRKPCKLNPPRLL